MSNIKQRSLDYLNKKYNMDYIIDCGGVSGAVRKIYMDACIEQRKEDIDEIWNVLFEHFNADLPFDKEWLVRALCEQRSVSGGNGM